MSRGRSLVEALAAAAPRYTPDDRARKLQLLDELGSAVVRDARTLLRLHETLCFLQAYPDDATLLAQVDRALESFHAGRSAQLGRPATSP